MEAREVDWSERSGVCPVSRMALIAVGEDGLKRRASMEAFLMWWSERPELEPCSR